MSVCRVLNDMNNNTRTKKEKTGEISVVLLRICQFNTGDEHDEQAGSNEYSINKRTKEQHSAKFCLSHKPSMKDTKKKRKKEDNDDKRYKDGHSQILSWGLKKKGNLCVCVYNEQKKRKRRKFTHITHTQEKIMCLQALVSFNSLICLIK